MVRQETLAWPVWGDRTPNNSQLPLVQQETPASPVLGEDQSQDIKHDGFLISLWQPCANKNNIAHSICKKTRDMILDTSAALWRMGASKLALTVTLCAKNAVTAKSNMIFVMWHIPYRREEYTIEIVCWTSRAGQFWVWTRDALRGCVLAIDAWDWKWLLHSQWCMVGIKNKPTVGGMNKPSMERVLDLSLPETQTQLLSRIE